MAINLSKTKDARYIAKQNLPGGVKKDDYIIYDSVKKKYFLERNNQEIMYDCAKEKPFFKKEEISTYKAGDMVHFPKQYSMMYAPNSLRPNRNSSLVVTPAMEFKVVSNQGKSYTLEMVSNYGVKILAAENLFQPIQYWKFYNTDGQLQRLIVGQNTTKEKFCKSIGNFFVGETADQDAKNWLKVMSKNK